MDNVDWKAALGAAFNYEPQPEPEQPDEASAGSCDALA